MAQIHQTAIIGSDVELDDSVFVGPYCIIEDHVKIGENTRLIAQCHIYSNTTIGAGNTIFPFATLGAPPNDYTPPPPQGAVERRSTTAFAAYWISTVSRARLRLDMASSRMAAAR